MPDGKSVGPHCPETNPNPNDDGTLRLLPSETPSPVGYSISLSDWTSSFSWAPVTIPHNLGKFGTALPPTRKDPEKNGPDPAIELLALADIAKQSAYELKRKHPSVVFTSGRRDRGHQASAMAENVALRRDFILRTYKSSVVKDACQRWVDNNKAKRTKDEIAIGLKGVLDGFTDEQVAELSRHLCGAAFDVRPTAKEARAIKETMAALAAAAKKQGHKHAKFLSKESGLDRWHLQF